MEFYIVSVYHKKSEKYSRIEMKWWTLWDLNPGPTGYEPAALTTELRVHVSEMSRALHETAAYSTHLPTNEESRSKIKGIHTLSPALLAIETRFAISLLAILGNKR